MSLINDALKRARDADRKRGATTPDLNLQPVESPAKSAAASRWLVLALVLVALALSFWSFSRWAITTPSPQASIATEPQSPLTATVTTGADPTPPSSPSPTADPEPLSFPSAATTTNTEATAPVPTPAFDPTTTVEPSIALSPTNTAPDEPSAPVASELPPELRLQSIIYRLRNPSVVINGRMLQKGDLIAEAQLIDIQRHKVTLRRQDSNIVLTLPDY
ncbi:MAG: hypothetical protein KJ072_00815 [Verrucomicrobia bacterium]|nr:hypothetical protein [Verrucomicrobiota bacterium]